MVLMARSRRMRARPATKKTGRATKHKFSKFLSLPLGLRQKIIYHSCSLELPFSATCRCLKLFWEESEKHAENNLRYIETASLADAWVMVSTCLVWEDNIALSTSFLRKGQIFERVIIGQKSATNSMSRHHSYMKNVQSQRKILIHLFQRENFNLA